MGEQISLELYVRGNTRHGGTHITVTPVLRVVGQELVELEQYHVRTNGERCEDFGGRKSLRSEVPGIWQH